MSDLISGPAGDLEIATWGAAARPTRWAVVCHPHPQFGGSMDNNVVEAVADAFLEANFGVVTFNFRGVGRSAGSFGGGEGECEDLLAVIAHVRGSHEGGDRSLVLAGYSFGAIISAMAVERGATPQAMLWVAPPIRMVSLPIAATDWAGDKALLCGTRDQFCPPVEARSICDTAKPRIQFATIANADHFFFGDESAVGDAVKDFLFGALAPSD